MLPVSLSHVDQSAGSAPTADVLARVDVARIFESLSDYIAIHEPVLDEFGSLVDARLVWWNERYEDVRVSGVQVHSLLSESYFDPEEAIDFASASWDTGRALQLFEFTPAKRSTYRMSGERAYLSVAWERVGDHIVEVGSDLTELRRLGEQLTNQQSFVYMAERDRALIAERERIARNLHDSVIQQIYAASLGLNAVATKLGSHTDEAEAETSRSAEVVKQIANGLSSLISTIREEIFSVHPDPLQSLRRNLEDVVLPLVGSSTVDCTLDIRVDHIDDANILSNLRAVVREAVSNAVRHAKCTRVRVDVHTANDGQLHVMIVDDGIGLSETVTRSSGLKNIEERARVLGGSSGIRNQPKGGVVLTWQVPLPELAR